MDKYPEWLSGGGKQSVHWALAKARDLDELTEPWRKMTTREIKGEAWLHHHGDAQILKTTISGKITQVRPMHQL